MQNYRIDRRSVLKGIGAGTLAAAITRPAFAQSRTIRIGLVMPQTGPLAFFSEHVDFVNRQIARATGGQLDIGGRKVAFELIVKDSQSNPNRASEVAADLILKDKVHVMMAAATPETTVPVADQCELNGVPCITTDTPIEPWFLGRSGDPAVGFEWTNHFFFSANQSIGTQFRMFEHVATNKKVGLLWPNDGDGNAFAQVFPDKIREWGFEIVDPGRYETPMASYAAIVSQFRAAGVEIVHGLTVPPEFTTFFNESAQQGFRPKVLYPGKTSEFPAALEAYGKRAEGIVTEIWWSPKYPYASSITGQAAHELADEYTATSGRQWSMPLGFRHAIFEVVFDGLKRAQDLDDPASIQAAFNATDLKTVCGPINFKSGPFPNTGTTPTAGGQWVKGDKFPLDLVITENSFAPEVSVERKTEAMVY